MGTEKIEVLKLNRWSFIMSSLLEKSGKYLNNFPESFPQLDVESGSGNVDVVDINDRKWVQTAIERLLNGEVIYMAGGGPYAALAINGGVKRNGLEEMGNIKGKDFTLRDFTKKGQTPLVLMPEIFTLGEHSILDFERMGRGVFNEIQMKELLSYLGQNLLFTGIFPVYNYKKIIDQLDSYGAFPDLFWDRNVDSSLIKTIAVPFGSYGPLFKLSETLFSEHNKFLYVTSGNPSGEKVSGWATDLVRKFSEIWEKISYNPLVIQDKRLDIYNYMNHIQYYESEGLSRGLSYSLIDFVRMPYWIQGVRISNMEPSLLTKLSLDFLKKTDWGKNILDNNPNIMRYRPINLDPDANMTLKRETMAPFYDSLEIAELGMDVINS